MIRYMSEYRQALQSIDRSVDYIIDDAEGIDRLLLDAAFGEESNADELALERKMRDVIEAARRMEKACSTIMGLAIECAAFENHISREEE